MKRILLVALLGFFSLLLYRSISGSMCRTQSQRVYGTQDRQTWPFSV